MNNHAAFTPAGAMMSGTPEPPWNSSSILVWGPPGATPDVVTLSQDFVQTPPYPNPVPFWRFRDAVEHAYETIANGRHAGKEPWIKAAETTFGPIEISGFYRMIRGGDAPAV